MQLKFKSLALTVILPLVLAGCAAGSSDTKANIPASDISPIVATDAAVSENLDLIALEEKQVLRLEAKEAKKAALKKANEVSQEESKNTVETNTPSDHGVPLALTSNDNSLLPGENGFQWMDRMQRKFGVYAYPGTQFFIAPATPCQHFAPQALGCTEQILDSVTHQPWHQNIKLHMAESAIGNLYVLFHEIGHTQGIMDECQADIYSRNITGIPGGFYC